MKTILLFFLASCSFWYGVSAQRNLIPGYVIGNKGDTIKGVIDYRNWERNPKKITFKKEGDLEKVLYTSQEIQEFRAGDEIYVSAVVDYNIKSNKVSSLEKDDSLYTKTESVFLQSLYRGEKNLLYLNTEFGIENFYITEDAEYILLVFKRYLVEKMNVTSVYEDKTIVFENRKFERQLRYYLRECRDINERISDISYDKKRLMELFDYYYNCTGDDIKFKKTLEKPVAVLGVLSGVSMSSLLMNSSEVDYMDWDNYLNSIGFIIGFNLELVLARNQGKWSLNNELLYTSYNVEGSFNEYENENNYMSIDYQLGFGYLKSNNTLRYNYPFSKFKIFLDAGFSNGFAVRESNHAIMERIQFGIDTSEEGVFLDDYKKHEIGCVVGVGAKYKNYSLGFRYELSNGMATKMHLKSKVNRYSFLLGYRFY